MPEQCIAPARIPPEILNTLEPIMLAEGDEIEVSADIVQRIGDKFYMRGSVVVRDAARIMTADRVNYDLGTGIYEIFSDDDGNAIVFTGAIEVQAQTIRIDTQAETVFAEESKYFVYFSDSLELMMQRELIGQGSSEELEFAQQVVYLRESSFSNCESDARDVQIAARNIELNLRTRQGKAQRAAVEVRGHNVLVLPTFLFPIGDERRSGFLFPVIGYTSKYGSITEIPYYFNLAPNYDATVGFNAYGRRGVMVDSELRYLGQHSTTTLQSEYLFDERGKNRKHLDDRYGAFFESEWHDGTRFYSQIDSRWVSDKHYLGDYDRLFLDADDKYLEQNVAFSAVGNYYKAQVGAQKFVISSPDVKEEERIWNRTPWIRLDVSLPLVSNLRAGLKFRSEKFKHAKKLRGRDKGGMHKMRSGAYQREGSRTKSDVYLEYRYEAQAGEFSVTAGSEALRYNLSKTMKNAMDDPPMQKEPKKPKISNTYSVADARLFFDHYTDSDSRWTIEPRVQVSRTKRIDQAELPIFDTAAANFENYADIFRTTSYLGGDRLRDTDKTSVGVSVSFDDFNNPDLVRRIGIGRVYYSNHKTPSCLGMNRKTEVVEQFFINDCEEVEVKNPDPKKENKENKKKNKVTRNRDRSDVVFGITLADSVREGRLGIVYDDDLGDDIEQTYASYTQRVGPLTEVKGLYRFLRDDDEQAGISINTFLKTQWRMAAFHVGSLERNRSLESGVYFEHISCCWSMGIEIAQEKPENKKRDTSFRLTFRVEGFGVN